MAQIAQQDNIVIKAGYLVEEQSEEVKKQLRRAYLRGTILDVVLDCETDEPTEREKAKILSVQEEFQGKEIQSVEVAVWSIYNKEICYIDCGTFQPEDYSDDVPYEGE